MRNKKCEKTMSGDHIWADYYDGIDEEATEVERKKIEEKGYMPITMYVPKFITKCKACGIINDNQLKDSTLR